MSDHTSLPTLPQEDLAKLAERVDQAFAEVQALETEAQNKAKALKSAIEEFHKVGLTRIVKHLKADERGKELLFELVDEPSVYALFAMHGLVRADLRTRVSRVIEMVRPYMQSHGGDVTFVDLQGDTVLVKLSGACNGCSMSSVTLRETVEEALREHVPEVTNVSVVPQEPAGLISVDSLLEGLSDTSLAEQGWFAGPVVDELEEGRPFVFQADEEPVLLLRLADGIMAYRNQCAHQGLSLENGVVDSQTGTLTCPWHGWCFDGESGECLTAPQAQLEQFPSRIVGQRVWVRPW